MQTDLSFEIATLTHTERLREADENRLYQYALATNGDAPFVARLIAWLYTHYAQPKLRRAGCVPSTSLS